MPVADFDLAGDGGGDESGAALLQEVDGTLGFGGVGVESNERPLDIGNNFLLFPGRQHWDR